MHFGQSEGGDTSQLGLVTFSALLELCRHGYDVPNHFANDISTVRDYLASHSPCVVRGKTKTFLKLKSVLHSQVERSMNDSKQTNPVK